MPDLFVNPELFLLKKGEGFLVYAPLQRSLADLSAKLVLDIYKLKQGEPVDFEEGILEKLLTLGVVADKPFPAQHGSVQNADRESPVAAYRPTKVTLLPTWDCNLRCVYCFARGGEDIGELMPQEVAQASIDLVVENALALKQQAITLSFHGGGDPFYKTKPLLSFAVDYARRQAKAHDLKLDVSSATNGMLSKERLDWIVANLDRVTLSWDGPPEFQDVQRPTVKGGPSSPAIERAAAFLDERKFPYGIRTTITKESVGHLRELVDYFAQKSATKNLHLESLFSCGRCATTAYQPPGNEEFAHAFTDARAYAASKGVSLYNSAAGFTNVRDRFCGAAGTNFFVTPAGDATACLEVSRRMDDLAEVFLIGSYDQGSGKFTFDQDKIGFLAKRTLDANPGCEPCFAKYACAGDCLAKTLASTGTLYAGAENYRCAANKIIIADELERKIDILSSPVPLNKDSKLS